jgi:hypothetical protein
MVPLEDVSPQPVAAVAPPPVVEPPAPEAVAVEVPEASRVQPVSPVSPTANQSAAEGLARLREEELALEERRKLLLELQEVEQKRQDISNRIAGLGGQG